MNELHFPEINDTWILSERGEKNNIDPGKPYAFLAEKERSADGEVSDCVVIFLTNKECSFHCLMCDLWKNTTGFPLPAGIIPKQIEYALGRLPSARKIKLYNSGSFFDPGSIPVRDYEHIASILKDFDTVVVESHPRLINTKCILFRDMLKPELQIAMGLETVNEEVLARLNKQMTVEDFGRSVDFLATNGIKSRAFILLRPPFMTEEEGIFWAERSVDFAFDSGVECCTIIPVRAGNGAMDKLMATGAFSPPDLRSLESVLEYGINLGRGRVFADTWDLDLFSKCDVCSKKRINRISAMNLSQSLLPPVECACKNV